MTWPMTRESALAFARAWIDAWNSHDLDRILAHYSEDFEMRSPLIQERMNEPTGVLKGKDRVRPYWAMGIQAQPPIRFELQSVYLGASSIAINYFSVGRGMRTEVVIFDETGKVVSGNALHG
jgi:ketosteroid isomerase-like protein